MRVAVHVLVSYGLLLLLGALWRQLPLETAMPDLVALSGVYLGLTARRELAPSMAGAVALGYLADLVFGSPRGMLAVVAGVLCIVGHITQGRIIVRGYLFTAIFSALSATVAGVAILILRAFSGLAPGGITGELGVVLLVALATGAVGPLVFRLFRLVDARLARTRRDRDAVLEGVIP